MVFLYGWYEHLFVCELTNEYFTRQIFKNSFWVAMSYMAVCFDYSIVILNTDISQGSVATYLRCDGIFKYEFVANFPVSLAVKVFRKSVNIWGSYGQEFSVFFDSRCRKTAINGESRSDRTRYHTHTRQAPPLPLASAAPRVMSRIFSRPIIINLARERWTLRAW